MGETTPRKADPGKATTPAALAPGASRWEHWWDVATLVLLVTIAVATQWWMAPVKAKYVADSITYVGGAQSIAEGNGYRLPLVAGNPAIGIYPPLQSVYLSTAWLINPHFPENQIVLKCLMIAAWGAMMAAFYAVLRRGGLPRWATALAILPVGLNVCLNYFIIHGYSDILFAVFGLGIVWLWLKPEPDRFVWKMGVSGILLGLMYLTRTAALGFLPGAVLAAVWACHRRRNWRGLPVLLAPVGLAILAWALMPKGTITYGRWLIEQYGSHGGIGGLLGFWWSQARLYFNGHHWANSIYYDCETVFQAQWGDSPRFLLVMLTAAVGARVALLVLSLYGAWKTPAHRGLQAAAATYVLQVLVWPFPLGCRVLFVLLPLMVLWAFNGARALPRAGTIACGIVGWVFLGGCLWHNVAVLRGAPQRLEEADFLPELDATGEWIRQNIPAEARIVGDFEIPMLQIFQKSRHPIQYVIAVEQAMRAQKVPYDYLLANLETCIRLPEFCPDGSQLSLLYVSPLRWLLVARIIPPTAQAPLPVRPRPEASPSPNRPAASAPPADTPAGK